VNLKVEDYFQTGKRSLIPFREKGGKETEIPVHHKLEELLDRLNSLPCLLCQEIGQICRSIAQLGALAGS
jgi:hypothetical protein